MVPRGDRFLGTASPEVLVLILEMLPTTYCQWREQEPWWTCRGRSGLPNLNCIYNLNRYRSSKSTWIVVHNLGAKISIISKWNVVA